ncbi:hypothetical protein I314_05126 [Cryptococcus bacillisporus CA1873]|uniref:Uncharacterized protein n=1 Tax=Cryptococcus bacillisporus CA1873 TaxID=1296111 RepID=A0ABR5B6C4_CRYGA|nr:hypothetical protein I314_05126 [Cryptococcus bacillisporus CA1873]|eukprot:KIR59142.1 hypothetical protein I314_05126 [Cryptococcus gattii CA1873]
MPFRKAPCLSKPIIQFKLPFSSFSYPPCTPPERGTPAQTPGLTMSQTARLRAMAVSFMIVTPPGQYSTQFPSLYPTEYPAEAVIDESSESDDQSVEDLTSSVTENEDGQERRWGGKGQEPLEKDAICPGAPKLSSIDLPN